jgi:hypothetical protein
VWIVVAVVSLLFAGLGILGLLGARERKVIEAGLQCLEALAEAEARIYALELLQRPGLFAATRARGNLEALNLPSGVSELLSQYEEVVRGEFWVGRAALDQPARVQGYVKIGEDFEFEEIVVRAGDSRVYSSYGDAPVQDPMESVRTVWHKIIEVSGLPLVRAKNGV